MDPLLSGHALFEGLGASPADRRKAYRELFRTAPDADFADALRAATNGGWALGDARFKRQIAKALSRRVAPLPKGRPPRRKPDRRQLNLLLIPFHVICEDLGVDRRGYSLANPALPAVSVTALVPYHRHCEPFHGERTVHHLEFVGMIAH
jgi:hypothetical protein